MHLRRKSQLLYFPIDADGGLDMPDNAVIVSVEQPNDDRAHQRMPLGVWAEVVAARYDEDSEREVMSG